MRVQSDVIAQPEPDLRTGQLIGTSEGGSSGSRSHRQLRHISTVRTNVGRQYEIFAQRYAQAYVGLGHRVMA